MSQVAIVSLACLVVASSGCGKSKAEMCADKVATPGGFIARACVYEVPNGAVVETDSAGVSTVRVNGKIVATHPPCPCVSGPIGGGGPPTSDAGAETPGDAMSDEKEPSLICHAGCLCATTAASCELGCYPTYTPVTDGGLGFSGCWNGPPFASEVAADVGTRCTYDNGGSPGKSSDFGKGCPSTGCAPGTVCVSEAGGIAGGGGEYCATIPLECQGTPSCACMGLCACASGVGLQPERCSDQSGSIACDNGIL